MNPTASDVALMTHTPVEVVPLHGEFVPLQRSGHRFLATGNGLWLEARRPWVHVVWPLALQDQVPMPFGLLEPSIQLAFGQVPARCFAEFAVDARASNPNEVGGVVVWDEASGEFGYRQCGTLEASRANVRSLWPELRSGEHVVCDIHSHGRDSAFFSPTDKRDMGATVVIACVLGLIDRETPDIALALFVCGVEIRCAVPQQVTSACRRGAVVSADMSAT
ncbi:PRTRC system protein A [Ottowia sp.]|uniref:PRTRC system protein A n=1 Tax=Ottowia sp. TaxID=1898956 RepID=UPI0025F3BD93|nr:PRTRC system protein A [Ottowia sp.]MBK6616373.1 PRTRC system protein A [Ottowia sp.]